MDQQTRQEILDLISMYSYGYDGRDWELFASIWTDDAVWEARGPLVTRDVIVQYLSKRSERWAAEGVQTRHYQTNTLLTPLSHDRISGRTMVFVTHQRAGQPAPEPVHSGVYHDEFLLTPDGWRIASRRLVMDHD